MAHRRRRGVLEAKNGTLEGPGSRRWWPRGRVWSAAAGRRHAAAGHGGEAVRRPRSGRGEELACAWAWGKIGKAIEVVSGGGEWPRRDGGGEPLAA